MSENQNSKGKKSQNSPKVDQSQMPPHIADIWQEFRSWTKTVHFLRPRTVDEILPQIYASKQLNNFRLASIFCIDVVVLQNTQYEQRLLLWADNIIHCFGKAATMKHYMAWKSNVSIDENVEYDIGAMDVVSFRVFLTDLHAMVHEWPEKMGKAFLNDLFFWVWQRINLNTTEI